VKAEGPVVLASMGIYLFNRTRLELALDNEMTDFGKNVIPWCIQHMRAFVHPFTGYWEDVGTIKTFYDAHMDLASAEPSFDFYEPGRPIYTHPRFLPNTRVANGALLNNALLSDGCIIGKAQIECSVIGVRSIISDNSVLRNVVMMGGDNYESNEQREESAGLPGRGVGANCQITRAIIDKNARIGDGVIITSHLNKPNEDGDCYYVRDGVVIIPKNSVVTDGRKI